MKLHRIIIFTVALGNAGLSSAAQVSFTSKELFRIPFGETRESLGSRIEAGNFIIPRDFTMDGAGRFYIYDTNHHRIARFSSTGKYEIGFGYPATSKQVFAHADAKENLWLLISDPQRGVYYGVYDSHGKRLREGVFSRFDQYRLHLDDDATLHVLLSSDKDKSVLQTYIMDEDNLRMKKENIAPPPENHHQVRKSEHLFFIDQVPDGSKESADHVNHVTDESHHGVADIQGAVIHVTDRGEIYTRLGENKINIYDISGSLIGKVELTGLNSACEAIRFDSYGNIYELDGVPDDNHHYGADMPGMRLMVWERP